jgi:hypothetical protein
MTRSLALLLALTAFSSPAFAQLDGNFTAGGGIRIGTSVTACSGAVEGAIRYEATADIIEYCNGATSTWTSLGGGSVSFPLLANPTGTVSAPAYSFNGDPNTGMFSDTADTVEFTAGGVQGLEVGTVVSGVNYLRITPNTTTNAATMTSAGSDTSGGGLGIRVMARDATTAGNGGQLQLNAGNGFSSGAGGAVSIFAGTGAGGGNGGNLSIEGGWGGPTSGAAGTVTIQGGRPFTGTTNLGGGQLNLAGGTATGSGQSKISFKVAGTTAAGALNGTGTTDRTPVERMALMGDGDFIVNGGASGYTGTASVPVSGAGTRMFFDTQKAAFRTGEVTGTQWDNANIGNYSFASGWNTTAFGLSSASLGNSSTASGQYSATIGDNNTASVSNSMAFGADHTVAGDYGLALGRELNITSTGDNSAGLGLTTANPATAPQISGAQSFGIFMGNHSAVNFSAANTMGLFGGKMVIDSTIPATNLTADTELEIDGTLKISSGGEVCDASREGAIQYLAASDTFQVCATAGSWSALGGGGGSPGGANTQVQFNDSGAFGGDTDYTWNKTTNVLTVTGQVSVSDRVTVGSTTGAAAPMPYVGNTAGAPAAGLCDADAERGRMIIDTTNNRLYVCNGATRGWDYVLLTN